MRNLAFYDILTQLSNRSLLTDRIKQAMAASDHSGHYCAVLFLELDKFKSLNDIHGHNAGDLLLTEVAHRITKCVREMDTVARFGGDEFVVVLRELSKEKDEAIDEARSIAEKNQHQLHNPIFWKSRT